MRKSDVDELLSLHYSSLVLLQTYHQSVPSNCSLNIYFVSQPRQTHCVNGSMKYVLTMFNYSILKRFAVAPSPAAKLFETGITTIVFAPPIEPVTVADFTVRGVPVLPADTIPMVPL